MQLFPIFKSDTGKVWIYVNNTDREIGIEFGKFGIPASDIVISFVPEEWRSNLVMLWHKHSHK